MKVIKTELENCVIIEPIVHEDHRGVFVETFQTLKYASEVGIKFPFVQDNYSRSFRGVLRGLHYQQTKPQGRLIRVVHGEVFDVAVDLRPDSSTFRQWSSIVLSGQNMKQIWIPPGFAHGFLVLSDTADLEYKCSEFYDPEDERQIRWNDPELNIAWPIKNPILSVKDSEAPALSDCFI